jgi:hypothetical protein
MGRLQAGGGEDAKLSALKKLYNRCRNMQKMLRSRKRVKYPASIKSTDDE